MRNLFLYQIRQEYKQRVAQISLVFAIIIFIQEWFRYPFSGYTAFVVMTLYIGFDIGTINNRLMHRFWGAMLAGIFSLIYWYIASKRCRQLL